ncbi:dihydrodipicolinate synthase family protein [Streptomyces sp. NPDC102462]|uniref:dihydrodipicolinate synthase family protein n=1 Tax=Streptomyces sp. NPDC102462 TaxID=3366178 RepID=UPI0037FDFAAA
MTDGRELLRGVMVPLVTPMERPGIPSAAHAQPLLEELHRAGVRSLMLLGSNGEGPLIPTDRIGTFAAGVAARWRALRPDGPVLVNVTAPGTAEAVQRAEAVRAARPDALVLSPPLYFAHREDEIVAHYAALKDLGVPVVAYNAPAYACPFTPGLVDAVLALEHVAGIKDSSGDPALLDHLLARAARQPATGVSQGAETALAPALRRGADGIVPGIANAAPGPVVALYEAVRAGDDTAADRWQDIVTKLLGVHRVRRGVPVIKELLAARGLCPAHAAPPFTACTAAERAALAAYLDPLSEHLVPARSSP